jgi:hypothetical protein
VYILGPVLHVLQPSVHVQHPLVREKDGGETSLTISEGVMVSLTATWGWAAKAYDPESCLCYTGQEEGLFRLAIKGTLERPVSGSAELVVTCPVYHVSMWRKSRAAHFCNAPACCGACVQVSDFSTESSLFLLWRLVLQSSGRSTCSFLHISFFW